MDVHAIFQDKNITIKSQKLWTEKYNRLIVNKFGVDGRNDYSNVTILKIYSGLSCCRGF
jgi:hypothetical protein